VFSEDATSAGLEGLNFLGVGAGLDPPARRETLRGDFSVHRCEMPIALRRPCDPSVLTATNSSSSRRSRGVTDGAESTRATFTFNSLGELV
jgi:hypothetical protein